MPKHKHHKDKNKEKHIQEIYADCKGGLVIPPHTLTDADAKIIASVWQEDFKDAAILPVIGFPSNSGGVVTFTHTMGDGKLMSINGLKSKSPLANNALGSFEFVDGKFLSLYEIMIPDIPGNNGEPSTAEIYVKALGDQGLQLNGIHFHFNGMTVFRQDKGIIAIHHSSTEFDPVTFSVKTMAALRRAMRAIADRT